MLYIFTFVPYLTLQLLLHFSQDALSARAASEKHRAPTPAQKTVQTQTDYRDSEAQTEAYSPDYVVKPGTQPEVLTLALLSYGKNILNVIVSVVVTDHLYSTAE